MSENDHVTTLLALIDAGLTHGAAYDFDDVPQQPPDNYVTVSLTRRFGGEERVGGAWKATTSWRAYVRASSRISIDNARTMLGEASGALEFHTLTVDGEQSTPLTFETAENVSPDDGWFSGGVGYVYTL